MNGYLDIAGSFRFFVIKEADALVLNQIHEGMVAKMFCYFKAINIFDWLAIYSPLIERWKQCGMVVANVRLKHGFADPVKHRLQISVYFDDIGDLAGYGEDENEILAYEKAICELFEREMMKRASTWSGKLTSNGVAAHRFFLLAKRFAKDELIERDAFLRHWLTKTPLAKIAMPKSLVKFSNAIEKSGHDLTIAHTYLGIKETVIAIIKNKSTGGFLIGSSFKPHREDAILKATREAFYNLAADFEPSSQDISWCNRSFSNHRRYWYENKSIPDWLIGEKTSSCIKPLNINTKFHYEMLSVSPVPVVACTSQELIDLWQGETPVDILYRIEKQYNTIPNLELHPFP